jgi:hypothetical protein
MPGNARAAGDGLAFQVTQRGANREKVLLAGFGPRLCLRLTRENLRDAGAKVRGRR